MFADLIMFLFFIQDLTDNSGYGDQWAPQQEKGPSSTNLDKESTDLQSERWVKVCLYYRFNKIAGQFVMSLWNQTFDILFKFVQVVAVPDLFLTAVKLSHDKTGAQYLHAARDDSNNLFRFTANKCLLSSFES